MAGVSPPSLQWALTLVAGNRWRRGGKPMRGVARNGTCFEWKPSREGSVSYMTHAHSAYPCTACAVKTAQGCCSIWEHLMVHTYDPWGLGSGQSERRTQIAHAAGGGGISYRNQHSVETGENHEKKMFWSFKKMRDVKRMMFYWHTKFQVETH